MNGKQPPRTTEQRTGVRHHARYRVLAIAAILAFACVISWFSLAPSAPSGQPASMKAGVSIPAPGPPPLPDAAFIGRGACAGCHQEQNRLWEGSHHDLAMQEAGENTVLGDFRGAELRKDGVVSRFFRREGRFMVRTEGPDGKPSDFEIKYTFGFTPLQQYLVQLPGGRLQALSIAWDSRPKETGGQRWFHLYPGETIGHDDELHWSKYSQNWNYMCAECHSTNLQKNYDPATRTYRTAWSEIDVACEACHGPGSRHVAWAQRKPGFERIDARTRGLAVLLDEHQGVRWTIEPTSGNAHRSSPRVSDKESQLCARCHARRAELFGDYRYGTLMDTHLPSLLQDTLYHVDGQIDGEVYEYGSFLQSKMHRAGVTCSDCHEPHSLKLRAPGNGICLQCHGAARYDSEKHHFHRRGAAGAHCIDCHMPARTYMVVDLRRDHSFRVPRPDLSVKLGTPNACTDCHGNKPPRWAADRVRQWYGHQLKGYQDYAEALHAARAAARDAEARLVGLLRQKDQPAIARATAAAELTRWLSPQSLPALGEALGDPEPLVRVSALQALAPLAPEQRWTLIHKLLRDPIRVVRALAAGVLADVPAGQMRPAERTAFQNAVNEYLAAQELNADDPGAQVNLGNFHLARGDYAAAEQSYREALIVNPNSVPALINLSDLYRLMGRDAEGEKLLRKGLTRQPKAAPLHHGLGLLQVRQRNLPAALLSLKRAVELVPEDAHFSYVYAVALHTAGRTRQSRAVAESALKRAPGDRALNELWSQLAAQAPLR